MMVAAAMGGTAIRPIPKPISSLAIHDWCERHGIAGDEVHEFRDLIDRMDDAWREEMANQSATPSEPATD